MSPCAAAVAATASALSCQMPKDESGPPTLVLPVPPLPRPGLKRTPTSAPGKARPKASSWLRLHAFTRTPSLTWAGKRPGSSSCEEMQICGRELSGRRAGRGWTRLLRRNACRQRALHLVAGGGVNVQPQRVEQLQADGGVSRRREGGLARAAPRLQNRRVRAALHRVVHRQAEGVRKSERRARLQLAVSERRLCVPLRTCACSVATSYT